MPTDELREKMHRAMCEFASLTPQELSTLTGATVAQAKQYKQEQIMKIRAEVNDIADKARTAMRLP